MKHNFFRSLGINPFPCDCSISVLWKDYKGLAMVFKNRQIIGFHRNEVPADFKYAALLPPRFPPLVCYSKTDGGMKTWDELDLTICRDDETYIGTTPSPSPSSQPPPPPPPDHEDGEKEEDSSNNSNPPDPPKPPPTPSNNYPPDNESGGTKGSYLPSNIPPFKNSGLYLKLI